jgi:very-short-patch-repair endonuclease
MTPSERKLWVHLRNLGLAGLKFRRQQPIGRFIVDFYCAEHRLVIELDGPIHSRQSARDRARTARLESQGYHEVRFKNEQVNEQRQLVLNEIVAACHNDIWNEGDSMKIKIETIVKADIDSAWTAWNTPEDIKQWNAASDDWHTTHSTVDLRVGGTFTSRMEAKDGSMGFDFEGTYTDVVDQERIEYEMADGRSVAMWRILF